MFVSSWSRTICYREGSNTIQAQECSSPHGVGPSAIERAVTLTDSGMFVSSWSRAVCHREGSNIAVPEMFVPSDYARKLRTARVKLNGEPSNVECVGYSFID